MNRLEEMEARLKAATPGEWRLEDAGPAGRGFSWRVVCEGRVLAQMRVYPGNGDDGLLMVYAPSDLVALLAVVRAGIEVQHQWLHIGNMVGALEKQRKALEPLLKEVEG